MKTAMAESAKSELSLRERFAGLPGGSIVDELVAESGTLRDYRALAGYHYREGRPSTPTRVLVLRHPEVSVADRWFERLSAKGDRVKRIGEGAGGVGGVGERGVRVGVLVESMPMLAVKMRDAAVGGRYGRMKDARIRAAALKREMRCITRVVVHPQWRGLGLAVRLVRWALSTSTTPLTEAIAAMGRVHPFFELAGMTAHHRPAHAIDARLLDAFRAAGFDGLALTRLSRLDAGIEALDARRRAWLDAEIERWHDRAHQQKRRAATRMERLRDAQMRLLCQPVYYIRDNRAWSE